MKHQELVENYRGYPKKDWIKFFDAIETGKSIEEARVIADISRGALLRVLEDCDKTFEYCLEEALYKGGVWKEYPEEWEPEKEWLEKYGQGN